MRVDEHALPIVTPSGVTAEYRWSFPHNLTLVVRVYETGETALAILQGNGLKLTEQGRTQGRSSTQGGTTRVSE